MDRWALPDPKDRAIRRVPVALPRVPADPWGRALPSSPWAPADRLCQTGRADPWDP